MTRTMALKEIGTPRLLIRPLNEEDVPNIYGIMSDYETASKTGFKPLSSTSEAEGVFKVHNNYNDEDELWCVIGDHGAPSLYRGRLAY